MLYIYVHVTSRLSLLYMITCTCRCTIMVQTRHARGRPIISTCVDERFRTATSFLYMHIVKISVIGGIRCRRRFHCIGLGLSCEICRTII